MRYLLLFFFTVLMPLMGSAQYTKIGAGITVGYNKLAPAQWHELINAYNGTFPRLTPELSEFKNALSYGIFGFYTVTDGIRLSPEFNRVRFKSETNDRFYPMELTAGFTDISLHGDVYILKFLPWAFGIQPEDAFDRFFVRASLTYSSFSFAATGISKKDSLLQHANTDDFTALGVGFGNNFLFPEPSDPTSTSSLSQVAGAGGTFRFGLALGYDFYINDQISITPVASLSFGNGTAVGLTDALLPEGTSGGGDQSSTFRRAIEFKVAYTFRPRIPLCPIPDCHVAQHHRHPMEFGDVIFRGKPHSLRQNPRHGQKHRGGDRKKLRKKLEKREARRKAKEEKERQKAEAEKTDTQSGTGGDSTSDEDENPPSEDPPADTPSTDPEPPSDDPDDGGEKE